MRHNLWLFVVFLAASTMPAAAQSVLKQITDQLRAQGFSRIEVSDTWLGRARIEARSRDWEREIIVNPRTGEILRDYSERRGSDSRNGGNSGAGLLGARNHEDDGKGRGRGRGGDDNSDDDKDNSRDSGNSGSGNRDSGNRDSGNSGSGKSGSGGDDGDSDGDGGGDD